MNLQTFFTKDKRKVFGSLWLVIWLTIGAHFLWKGVNPHEAESPQLKVRPTALSEDSSPPTKPIEQIQVGERVATGISKELRELADAEIGALPDWDSKPIDPDSWRKVKFTLTRDNGSAMEIVLLRPAAWITENGIAAGREVFLAIPEMRQQGMAYIEAVGKCPDIKEGNGRVVTGAFASTVTEVVEVHIDGLAEPIRSTPEHPFYRVDDKQFVPASELRHGDRVQHLGGLAQVERVLPRTGTFRVHNLEVHGEHVFRVSSAGVLVHNTWPGRVGVHWTSRQSARGMDATGVIRATDDLVWFEVAESPAQLRRILHRGGAGTGARGNQVAQIVDLNGLQSRKVGAGGQAFRLPNGLRLTGEGGRGITWWQNTGSGGQINRIVAFVRDGLRSY